MFNFWPFNIAAKKREAAKREQERLERHVKMEKDWRDHMERLKRKPESPSYSQQQMALGAQNRAAFQQRQALAHPSQSSSTAYDPMTDMLNHLSPFSPVSVWNTSSSSHSSSSYSDDSNSRSCSSSSYDSGSSYSSDSSSGSCDSSSSYSSD